MSGPQRTRTDETDWRNVLVRIRPEYREHVGGSGPRSCFDPSTGSGLSTSGSRTRTRTIALAAAVWEVEALRRVKATDPVKLRDRGRCQVPGCSHRAEHLHLGDA